MTAREPIVALSTPPGVAALALVRLSGAGVCAVVEPLLARPIAWQPARATHRTLRWRGEIVDDVVLTFQRAPHSATGEDTLEITTHGNPRIVQNLIQACLEHGARLARPGEFTERALLNDKLALTEAEGLLDLLRAPTERALAHARAMKEGRLGQALEALRIETVEQLSQIEAALDFSEEGVTPAVGPGLVRALETMAARLAALLRTAPLGRLLREGALIVLIGEPNVGKSSLLNALLQEDRAIVAPTPGTTRDLIEATCNLRGLPVRLVDTAGQRAALDPVEQEGARRARAKLAEAHLILHLVEANQPYTGASFAFPESIPVLLVANKADLGCHPTLPASALALSARTGVGLAELQRRIEQALLGEATAENDSHLAINARQNAALQIGAATLARAQALLVADAGLELVSLELRALLAALADVIGATDNEAILDRLFQNFCIGK